MITRTLARRHQRCALAAIAGLVLLAGCGTSTQKSTPNSTPGPSSTTPSASASAAAPAATSSAAPGSPSSTPAGAGSAGTGAAGSGAAVNVCTLLPAAMAATLTGVAVTQTKSDNTPAAGLSRCNYMNDAGTAGFDVSYIGSHAKSGFDAELEAAKTVGGSMAGPTVTGVGDAAFVNHFGMSALYGDAEIHVAIISTLTQAQMTTLIEALHAKL